MEVVERTVTKSRRTFYWTDNEVYVRVAGPGLYSVAVKAQGKLIKYFVTRAQEKRVKRRGKEYKYYYVRLMVPWASTLYSRGINTRKLKEIDIHISVKPAKQKKKK